jgi:two-component system C4-dicarboxylate transport response regulator DctD
MTDYDMPTMDGLALIRALKARRPDLRVVVSSGLQSGFDAAALETEVRGLGVAGILAKPYTPEKILTVIHKAIAR